MTTFVFTANPPPLNWDKRLILFLLTSPLLPSAFYFYSLPHSSTLFSFAACFPTAANIPQRMRSLNNVPQSLTSKRRLLLVLSSLLTLMREKQLHQAACYSQYLSIVLHISFFIQIRSPNCLSSHFFPISSQYQYIEHEIKLGDS